MKINFLTILLIIYCILASCDDEKLASPGDVSTFVKLYGGSNTDNASMVVPTADGGYILLGNTEIDNKGTTVKKIKLIKTDKNGNTTWQRMYPPFKSDQSDYKTNFVGRDLLIAKDGYIIVGDSIHSEKITRSSLFLMKVPLQPKNNDYKHLAIDYRDNQGVAKDLDIHGIDAIIDSNNDIRVIANVKDGTKFIGSWFGKINADFTFDPASKCNYAMDGKINLVQSLSEATDGTFVFGGTNKNDDIDNTTFRKLPPCFKGVVSSPTNVIKDASRSFTAHQFVKVSDGYALVGTHVTADNRTDVFFALLDRNGLLQSGYPIVFDKLGANEEEGYTIAQTDDGGFIIGGSTLSNTAGGEDILLLKITYQGDVQWTKLHGSSNSEKAKHIFQNPDGGYTVIGNTAFGGIETMVLIKTDENGNVN